MAVDHGRECGFGLVLRPGQEPLDQLAVGQTSNRANREQRLDLAECRIPYFRRDRPGLLQTLDRPSFLKIILTPNQPARPSMSGTTTFTLLRGRAIVLVPM
jgi:hypothetical protein